jgi:hypothetical protein
LPSCKPARGNQIPGNRDGANDGGEPPERSLSGPSPSANLVGIWKGDPLVPAGAGHHGLPNETRYVLAR